MHTLLPNWVSITYMLLSVWAWSSICFILMALEKCCAHTEDTPEWDVYLHLSWIFGQWRMLGGCGVAEGAASWEKNINFRQYRWYLCPARTRLELGDDSTASSRVQLGITFCFPYRHMPSLHPTDLCLMMMLSRMPSHLLALLAVPIKCNFYNIFI